MYRHEIIHMRIIEMVVCVTWVSYANLYILMALCGNAVYPMHQQQGCRGLALGHRYRAWTMALCLTGTRPVSISKLTLCIPMKLGYVLHGNTSMCDIWVLYQDYIPGWIDVRLRNLQYFSSGDAAAFHQAIDVHVKVFLATIGLENGCTSVGWSAVV